ncbi:hypothetical protein GH714_030016 [Hevea brasiliensis]|uniref:Methyltransferase n=1 Tax=Hevea brasiliensis TaxID=3981 RepID=A0A6A6L266_HEVBR|nr:hypothetical protein GH714_030016 [Hevea brasiliensis]
MVFDSPPKDYKIPLRWPVGRDVIWSGNVKLTKDQFLSSGSMTKRLMLLEENQIAFHSEDGLIFDGVKDYSHQVAEMIGLGSDSEFLQAGVQTVLDIGCGFGSFGAHLASLKLMAVCVAPYEATGSQVQLALERGLPAIIGNFNSRKLPYPSLSFDMVHCAQCGINWDEKDGILLIEVDRVLKPGAGTTSKRWIPIQNKSLGYHLSSAELQVHGNRFSLKISLKTSGLGISSKKLLVFAYTLIFSTTLRGQGWIVLSDKLGAIEMARALATQIHWEARVIDLRNGSDQRLLVCQNHL